MSRLRGSASLVVLVLLFGLFSVALPLVNGYYQQVAIYLLIDVILVASFRFITTMGRWSFAHVPLSGVGGYTSAILTAHHGMSFWVTLELGGLAAAAIALVLSYPCLRTSGLYFFMSTFAAGALIVWSWTTFINPFGGINGIYGVAPPDPLRLPGLPLHFDTRSAMRNLVAIVTRLAGNPVQA